MQDSSEDNEEIKSQMLPEKEKNEQIVFEGEGVVITQDKT